MKPEKLRKGMWVRLKGWQMHWPQQNAKIASVSTDRTDVVLDRPICGRKAWKMSDLSKSF